MIPPPGSAARPGFPGNGSLRDTLTRLLESGSESNPALNRLIRDYAVYHAVLVPVGGCFVVALLAFSAFSWRRFNAAPRDKDRRWSFEKKTYLCFGTFSVMIGLLMAVIVAANLSSVLDSRKGFAGSIGILATPERGTQSEARYQAFNSWLQSGRSSMPTLIRTEIDNRLAWQRPKAVICTVLLALFVWLSTYIWRTLINKSRTNRSRRTIKERALLPAGVVSIMVALLLMLMVIGNTQASIAPLGLTLFYG